MVWDAWPSTLAATVANPPAVNDFAVKVLVSYQTGMRSDFADLRFSKDGAALSHTIWAYSAGVSAEVWVKVPLGTTSFTLHYGNVSAADASDPNATFLFCERWTGYFSDRWNHIYKGQADSTTYNTNNQALISPPANKTVASMRGLESKATFSKGIVVEYNDKLTSNSYSPGITLGTGNLVDFNGGSTRWDQCAHETGYSAVHSNTLDSGTGTYLQRNATGGAVVLKTSGPGYAALGTFTVKRLVWGADNSIAFENNGVVVVSATDSTWASLTGARLVIYQGWYNGNGGTRTIDWIRIRPYQATEPVVTIGPSVVYEDLAGTIAAASAAEGGLTLPVPSEGTLTLYPVDDSCHEHRLNNSSLATLRAAAGNGGARMNTSQWACNLETASDTTNGLFLVIARAILSFDTSAIPQNATILSAKLKLTRSGGNSLLGDFATCLVSATPADPTYHNISETDNDYANVGFSELADQIAYSNWAYLAQHTFVLNEKGLSSINKGGYTSFALRTNWDRDNTFGGTWGANKWSEMMIFSKEDATQANWPILEVSYRVGTTHEMEGTIPAVSGMAGQAIRLRSCAGLVVAAAATVTGRVARLRGLNGTAAAQSVSGGYLQAQIVLAGGIAVQAGMSARVTRVRRVNGSVIATGLTAGYLQAVLPLSGALASASASAGALARARRISGAIPAASTFTGSLKADLEISGSIQASSSCTSVLRATLGIGGSITAPSSCSGSLNADIVLNGSLNASSSISGPLQAVLELGSTVSAQSAITGSVIRIRKAGGAVSANASLNGSVKANVYISGAVSGNAGVSGSVIRIRRVTGETISAVMAEQSALLQATRTFGATVPSTSQAAGPLSALVPLTGVAIEAHLGVTAAVIRLRHVAASPSSTSGLEGLLRAAVPVSGSVAAQTDAAGTFGAEVFFRATVPGSAIVAGAVTRLRTVVGAVAASATVGAAGLSAPVPLTGQIPAVSGAIGQTLVEVPLMGTVTAQTGMDGTLEEGLVLTLTGLVPAETAIDGALHASVSLNGTSPGVASGAGTVTRLMPLIGAMAGESGTSGVLSAPVPVAGGVAAQGGIAGTLEAGQIVPLTGEIASAITVNSASLSALVSLNGAVSTILEVAGAFARTVPIDGISEESSGAIAGLFGAVPCSGAVPAQTGMDGTVVRLRSCSVLVPCSGGLVGALSGPVPCSGAVSASSGGSATIATARDIDLSGGLLAATTGMAGAVQPVRGMAGTVEAVSGISGNCAAAIPISGTSQGVSSGDGQLAVGNVVEISGSVSAASINTGTINRGRSLSGETVSGVVSLSGAITTPIALGTEVQAVSLAQADLSNSIPIASVVTARSGIAGVLGVRSTRTVVTTARSLAATTSRQGRAERFILACIQAVHGNAATLRSQTVVVATYLSRITAELEIRIKTLKVEDFKVFEADLDFAAGEAGLDFGAGELESDFMAVEAASSEGFMVMELELDFQVIEV